MCQRRKVERALGIGEVRSKAVIKGRPSKGNALVERKILTQPVDNKIKDQVIATQAK